MPEMPKGLPEPGTWTIDTVHSFVAFSVEHFTVAFARGISSGPTGSITIAEDPTASEVEAVIDVSTITTGNAARDEKIQGPDVLDIEHFKTIDFRSNSLRELGENHYALDGELTLHGVTRPVTLDLTVNGVVEDTWGKTRLGLTATTDLQRDEFGSGDWGHRALAAGGFMVPHSVQVTLEIEATKDEPEA
jgi:polyisoprenoid-binding protein YceI